VVFAVTFIFVGSTIAQNSKATDISGIAAAGKISGDTYSNSLLRITVDAPNGTLQLNPFVNKEAGRARLVQILSKEVAGDESYTFAVVADTLSRYPQLHSSSDYVRSVRHQLEREGFVTLREEFPINIDGVQFTGAVLRAQTSNGREHCRGLYTTFRDGYIVSVDAEAANEQSLTQLVTRLVKFPK
jgi:hypothetical protein